MNYPIEKFDVYTLNVGYSCNNADWNWKNIQSPFARLYLVLNGKAKIVLPDGTYELTLTMSPKFGVVLPLLCGVTGRSGIRIHTGTKPEHSKGCVLVTPFGKKQITDFIHQNYMNNEKTFIHIDSDGLRGSGHDEL